MTISDLLNVTGILILMFGGCIGMIGSFSEKNNDIVDRTDNSFGNIEFYKSMILQKYFNIFSFFFIATGSFFLLLPYLLAKKFIIKELPKPYLILAIIIIFIVLSYFLFIKWITYKIDKITVSNQILLLTNKTNTTIEDYNLKLIVNILHENFEQIIESAKKYFKIKKH
jgi:VIT1/CCC1 family predicted Fe2+/Mn2+ transporter